MYSQTFGTGIALIADKLAKCNFDIAQYQCVCKSVLFKTDRVTDIFSPNESWSILISIFSQTEPNDQFDYRTRHTITYRLYLGYDSLKLPRVGVGVLLHTFIQLMNRCGSEVSFPTKILLSIIFICISGRTFPSSAWQKIVWVDFLYTHFKCENINSLSAGDENS